MSFNSKNLSPKDEDYLDDRPVVGVQDCGGEKLMFDKEFKLRDDQILLEDWLAEASTLDLIDNAYSSLCYTLLSQTISLLPHSFFHLIVDLLNFLWFHLLYF